MTMMGSPFIGGGGGSGTATAFSGDALAQINTIKNDLGINFLRDAIADGWTIFNMTDGFTDVYTDETGIDTVTSTNEIYNASGDFYGPSGGVFDLVVISNTTNGSTTFVDSTGNATGVVVNGDAQHSTALGATGDEFGGPSSSMYFDGVGDYVRFQGITNSHGTGDFHFACWIRLDNVTGTKIIASAPGGGGDYDFKVINDTLAYRIGGADRTTSGAVLSAATWHHVAFSKSSGNIQIYLDGTRLTSVADANSATATSTDFDIGADAGTSPFAGYIGSVAYSSTDAGIYTGASYTVPTADPNASVDNMTLVSVSQTADSTPTSIRAVILYTPIDTVTLNTDLVMSASRDGGTTFTDFTLTEEADYGTIAGFNGKILVTDELDISAQPSGTSMEYRWASINNVNHRINGVYLQWR